MSSSVEAHHPKYVLINSGESYLGYAIARHMAREAMQHPGKMKKNWRVRVLCQNLQGLEGLIEAGVDLQVRTRFISATNFSNDSIKQQVNYQDEEQLRRQMRHVRSVIVIPVMGENRLPYTLNVINAASIEDVKRVHMVSFLGCEHAEDRNSPLGQYHQIESHIRNTFAYGRWCIFRTTFFHQATFMWNAMIQKRGILGMPLPGEATATSIDIEDLCDAITTYILSPKKQEIEEEDSPDSSHIKRVYELTGSCPYSNNDVVKQLNDALGEGSEITYQEISEEEMREYFKSLPQHPPESLLPPVYPALNDAFIDFMMDGFKLAKHYSFEKVTDDLRDLTGREPMDLAKFFIENRNQFRRPEEER